MTLSAFQEDNPSIVLMMVILGRNVFYLCETGVDLTDAILLILVCKYTMQIEFLAKTMCTTNKRVVLIL